MVYYVDYPEENIFVIHNGIDKDIHFPESNGEVLKSFGISRPYYIYIGEMGEYRKNVFRIISAFEKEAEKNKDIQLVFAGYNRSTSLETVIGKSRFNDRIILTGYVTDEQKRALLSDAVALLFPSLYEGFGLPIIEAMACGCPVITSNISSMPEVAGDAALLIDPYNVEQLAYEMERVLEFSSLRNELIERGFKNCERFSWEKCAVETEKVYKIADERN